MSARPRRHDAHVIARRRLLSRIEDRMVVWFTTRGGPSKADCAAACLAAYRWPAEWGMIPAEPYSPFGPRQRLKLAKDVPAAVIHDIMCSRPARTTV